MINVAEDWNPKQAGLKEIILKPDKFEEAISLCLEMHKLTHTSEMSGLNISTFEDQLWDGLTQEGFKYQDGGKGSTIAWDLWHLTRIEDLTTNILIDESKQIFNIGSWAERICAAVSDTGNAMTDEEIAAFSSNINMEELRHYRIQVGRQTQKIIRNLKPEQMKRKIRSESIKRILDEGGVTEADQSIWLLDFWGRKNVAGILLMPVTRHQIVHLNDALKIKANFFRTFRIAEI